METQNELLVEYWGNPYHTSDTCDTTQHTPIVESRTTESGTFLEGIFMQAEVVNRNGRKYPKKVLENAVNKYIKEQVNTNQALGELNHPSRPNVDPAEAAIRITELYWEGDNVMGKAKVLDTPRGKIVKSLIEGGWVPGVSSRGLGSVKQINGINEVQDGFRLTVGVDVVWGPSAPNAYVQAKVNESEKLSTNDADSSFSQLAEKLGDLLL